MKILLIGAGGRLGSAVGRLAQDQGIGVMPIGRAGSSFPSDVGIYLPTADVVLDVSTPVALLNNLPKILVSKKPLVIGSTGHMDEAKLQIRQAAETIPLLLSSNFSLGIASIQKMIPHLPIGSYHITETHHSGKKDSPSGTALDLAARLPKEAKITSIRQDPVIGEHVIHIHLPFETITITHSALSRDVFAYGALEACKFLVNQPPGFYTSFYE